MQCIFQDNLLKSSSLFPVAYIQPYPKPHAFKTHPHTLYLNDLH
jgi:hypothetical protein